MHKNKVIVICGPTSSGKTHLGLELAAKINGEIVSADSRQIYRHMNVGTGKVPIKTSARIEQFSDYWTINDIPVYGYDLVKPGQYFSAYDYYNYATEKIVTIAAKGKTPLLIGGTGFYVDTVTGIVTLERKQPDFELRKKLERLTLKQLQKKLSELNPEIYLKIDQKNPARITRAIEKALTIKDTQPNEHRLKNWKFTYIGLTAPREILYSRVDKWLEEIWPELLIETSTLIEMGYGSTPQLTGLIYKSVPKNDMQKAKFDLHGYIRRQQTWFKKNPNINWLDITQKNLSEKALNIVKSVLDG